MSTDRQLSRRRTALLLVALVAVAGAVVWFAARPEQPLGSAVGPVAPAVAPEVARLQSRGHSLRTVQPGLTRTEVEGLLGRADPNGIGAVERVNGQAVYRVRYTAILTEPPPSAPNVRGYCEAELLFDAGRAGHPLLGITFTPKPPPPGLAVCIAA